MDLRNFSYVGSCGFEVPAPIIKLDNGKQAAPTPAFDKLTSTARLTGSQELTLGGRRYLLARFACSIGTHSGDTHSGGTHSSATQDVRADHLIGSVNGKPTDLGIVATGTKITADTSGGKLSYTTSYRTINDAGSKASGTSAYDIELVGRTPVRVYAGQHLGAQRAALRTLPAHAYDAGLVGIDAYVDDPSDSTWLIGLLNTTDRVLTADTIGGGYQGECLDLAVYTRDNERLTGGLRAFPDDDSATGTALDLKSASTSPTGALGSVSQPVKSNQAGLLVPANGVVPAPATLTTRTSSDALKSPLVTSKAPADAWLDVWRFGAASGSEYPLPVGAFTTAGGKIAMTGAWYNEPINESTAAVGMTPILAAASAGEKTCG